MDLFTVNSDTSQ